MRTSPLRRPVACLLLATLSMLTACSDTGAGLTSPTDIQRAVNVVEGRRISGTVTSRVVRQLERGTEVTQVPEESFSTEVLQGFAVTPDRQQNEPGRASQLEHGMLVAAAAFPAATETRRLVRSDSTGRKHEFVTTLAGRRLTHFEYLVDGARFVNVDVHWEKRGDLYVSTGRVATIDFEGKSATVVTTLRPQAARANAFRQGSAVVEANVLALYAALAPQPAHAQEFTWSVECGIAIAEMIGAAIVLGAAWEASFIAWYGAYMLFGAAYANFIWTCYGGAGE